MTEKKSDHVISTTASNIRMHIILYDFNHLLKFFSPFKGLNDNTKFLSSTAHSIKVIQGTGEHECITTTVKLWE